jgi:hypothetical protein
LELQIITGSGSIPHPFYVSAGSDSAQEVLPTAHMYQWHSILVWEKIQGGPWETSAYGNTGAYPHYTIMIAKIF